MQQHCVSTKPPFITPPVQFLVWKAFSWFALFLSLLNWLGLSPCLFVSARCVIAVFITVPSSSCWPSQIWFNFEQERHIGTNLFVSSLGYCPLKDSFIYIHKSFYSNTLKCLIAGIVPTSKSEKLFWPLGLPNKHKNVLLTFFGRFFFLVLWTS